MRQDSISGASSASLGKPIACGWRTAIDDVPTTIPNGYSTISQIMSKCGMCANAVRNAVIKNKVPYVMVRWHGRVRKAYKD